MSDLPDLTSKELPQVELRRDKVFRRNYYEQNTRYNERELRWFDEGPDDLSKDVVINSSSISTAEIDQFRQGVELTQEKHNLGIFKISAGTQGHIVDVNCIGITNMELEPKGYFKSMERFNAVEYLTRKVLNEEEYTKYLIYPNFPVPTSDFDQSKIVTFNGVLEPLTIRSVALFSSMDFPYEYRDIHGDLHGGNMDARNLSSDRVLSVDYVPKKLSPPRTLTSGSFSFTSLCRSYANNDWFGDAYEYSIVQSGSQLQPTLAYSEGKFNTVDPFSDNKVYYRELGITATKHGQDMVNLFQRRAPEMADSYVPPGKKSANAGMVYDYSTLGTDSIAYGGTGY